jgi:hypothetical protein
MIQRENGMIFKINRPSYQTKSSFVENVLKMRDQISNFLCSNPNSGGAQYEKIVRNFISANLRESEAKKIIDAIPAAYTKELNKLKELRKAYFSEKDEDQAYFIAWDEAYKSANQMLDKYYRIKGNELRIGVISKYGFNPDGIAVEFADSEVIEQESKEIAQEAAQSGH